MSKLLIVLMALGSANLVFAVSPTDPAHDLKSARVCSRSGQGGWFMLVPDSKGRVTRVEGVIGAVPDKSTIIKGNKIKNISGRINFKGFFVTLTEVTGEDGITRVYASEHFEHYNLDFYCGDLDKSKQDE